MHNLDKFLSKTGYFSFFGCVGNVQEALSLVVHLKYYFTFVYWNIIFHFSESESIRIKISCLNMKTFLLR